MNYKNLNDFELIYQVRDNDSVAYNALIGKYSNLVGILVKKYLPACKKYGIEYDDLYQEGMLGIIKALNDFNSEDTLFYTYAQLCAKREMEKLIKMYSRKKHKSLNESISISQIININKDLSLSDLLPSSYSLEDDFNNNEILKKAYYAKYDLSFIESNIYELKFNGFNLKEIASLLKLPYRKVDYYMCQIRKKMKKKYYDAIKI